MWLDWFLRVYKGREGPGGAKSPFEVLLNGG